MKLGKKELNLEQGDYISQFLLGCEQLEPYGHRADVGTFCALNMSMKRICVHEPVQAAQQIIYYCEKEHAHFQPSF